MIPKSIEQKLNERGYRRRSDDETSIRNVLDALDIDSNSELGSLYLTYDPSLFLSNNSYEQLQDVLPPVVDGGDPVVVQPEETPVGMTTRFIRDCWELPEQLICLTSAEGEGGYLYDSSTGQVFDFDLKDRRRLCDGTLPPRWNSLFEFLEWYVS